jgi:transcriptional regulator with XRE-family HTH domain
MDYSELGADVMARRQARGWSRRELARRAGISDTTLKYMESGTRPDGFDYAPSQTTLRNVADAFGGADAADILRAYGRDDMARYVEASFDRGLHAVRAEPELTPDQERAIERIVEELTRLLATANLSGHKGAYISSARERVESRPAA